MFDSTRLSRCDVGAAPRPVSRLAASETMGRRASPKNSGLLVRVLPSTWLAVASLVLGRAAPGGGPRAGEPALRRPGDRGHGRSRGGFGPRRRRDAPVDPRGCPPSAERRDPADSLAVRGHPPAGGLDGPSAFPGQVGRSVGEFEANPGCGRERARRWQDVSFPGRCGFVRGPGRGRAETPPAGSDAGVPHPADRAGGVGERPGWPGPGRGRSSLAPGFRVEPLPDQLEGVDPPVRTFRYRLRPAKSGRVVLPPVAVAAFDPTTRRYATRVTASLPIQVEEPPRFDPGSLSYLPFAKPSSEGNHGVFHDRLRDGPRHPGDPGLGLLVLLEAKAGSGPRGPTRGRSR